MSRAPDDDASPSGRLWRETLGYLNFSSGAPDGKFLRALADLFETLERAAGPGDRPAVVDLLLGELGGALARLARSESAFADASQARGVLQVAEALRREYAPFHRDLLWGVSDDDLWRPFFFGRALEAILAQGPPWDRPGVVQAARDRLDDYLGYRPIAVLETKQKIEPYRHEWVRPIPLYIESAGVACGRYQALIERALRVLHGTDEDLLRAAWFDPAMLEELAVDPRAYDFDHPVHKRPNHHFGLWDPNRIDAGGAYRRFVLQPLLLESLMARVEGLAPAEPAGEDRGAAPGGATRDELLDEAAAVLAGTILMASGVSGAGPGSHSGDETLATLLPQIAAYRDRFYQQLLERATGAYGARLRAEAERMRQPLAGARQHLNHEIAARRARQLQRVHVARVYARMGYADAALEEARAVRVASARILCEVYCRLTAGHQALDRRDLPEVARTLTEIDELVKRGIECGALVDPWNVVGFGGNFSLFPAVENTVHDFRVDDLIQVVEQTLGLCSRAWTEAAAVDDSAHEEVFGRGLEELAAWWDQFATPVVSGVRRLVGKEVEVSTNLVAGALNAWRKAGSASGDIGFWGMFVDQFDTPKAFHLVIEALLEKGDLVASMALLMRWLCQVDYTPLEDGDASFHPLALAWLRAVEADGLARGEDRWPLVSRFFDHLEANAEGLWDAPRFELGARRPSREGDPLGDDPDEEDEDFWGDEFFGGDPLSDELEDDELGFGEDEDEFDLGDEQDEEDEDDEDDLYGAAYEGVTFEGSTEDGMDSAIFEPEPDETRLEFEEEADRIEARLAFLKTVARLWKHAAVAWGVGAGATSDRSAMLALWRRMASQRCGQLGALLDAVHRRRLTQPRGDHESMVEFDRLRSVKEALVEGVVQTCVEMGDAARLLRAAAGASEAGPPPDAAAKPERPAPAEEPGSGGAGPAAPDSAASDGAARDSADHDSADHGEGASGGGATGDEGPSSIAGIESPTGEPDGAVVSGGAVALLRAALRGESDEVSRHWDAFKRSLQGERLLYVPLSKGGEPRQIVRVRALHRLMDDLAAWLPRLGRIRETCELLAIAQRLEVENPVGRGAVTEFDRLFETAYQAIVRCLVASADDWDGREGAVEGSRPSDGQLVEALQDLTESQLERWLRHSRTVRLSVVERLAPERDWERFVHFVERYGADLFTQRFLTLGNLRALLHRRVGAWLDDLAQEGAEDAPRLVADLDIAIQRDEAARQLGLAIEAVVENYREYRDYNATTTQSDRGELLHGFVDFLRLRNAYDRVSWNLKPVYLAHKILVRSGRQAAAALWRGAVAERTREAADAHQAAVERLVERYGMRLPSIAERLAERFVRPLTIDRLRALVEDAMAPGPNAAHAIEALRGEVAELAAHPAGAGLDTPDWVAALEDEVTEQRRRRRQEGSPDDPLQRVPQRRLSWDEVRGQLAASRETLREA